MRAGDGTTIRSHKARSRSSEAIHGPSIPSLHPEPAGRHRRPPDPRPVAGRPGRGVHHVLTGGTSGVYYPLGVALSKIFGDTIPGRAALGAGDQGVGREPQPAQPGKGELAFTLGDSLRVAWAGNEEAGFKAPLNKLRGIAAIYPNYIQLVATQELGHQDPGRPQGQAALGRRAQIRHRAQCARDPRRRRITYQDLGKVEYLPFAESVELMKNRQLDATLQSAGLGRRLDPRPGGQRADRVVEIPAAIVEKVGAPYVAATIPAGTYDGPGRGRADGRRASTFSSPAAASRTTWPTP